jgi:hypothetical protein
MQFLASLSAVVATALFKRRRTPMIAQPHQTLRHHHQRSNTLLPFVVGALKLNFDAVRVAVPIALGCGFWGLTCKEYQLPHAA